MKKIVLLIAFIQILPIFSQLTPEEEKAISNSLSKKINAVRKQKGLHILERSENLAEAAKLQANFMSKESNIIKTQPEELYQTTEKRVKYHSNDYDVVTENVIRTKPITPPFHSKKITFIAQIVFNSWKKNPESYKNMISGDYNYGDFGVSYNETSKQFYISQVFGHKPYKVPNQLSETSFGIKENDNSCGLSEEYQNTLKGLAPNIYIKNNEVFLDISHTKNLAEIITSNDDGFAVDIITRNQLQCGVSNKLDASTIYNGILLKPIYKNEIFTTNKTISLGKVPDHLKNQEVSANLIVLKNNTKCQYIVANHPSEENYSLLPVEIELEKPYIDLRNQGIFIAKEIFFDFETSQSVTDKYTEAQFDLDNVHSFSIKSYTSIDGSERSNTILQNKRAEFIKKHIGDVLGFSLDFVKIRIDARENWPLYNYQLKLYGYDHMLNKGKTEKRAFANGTLKNIWDEQFGQQRKSKIIAFQHGYWNRNNKQHGFYNLLNGLITDDVHLVNKSLLWLYDKEVNYDLNKDFILDRLLTNKDLVQNVAAIFDKNIDKYDLSYIVFFLDHWLPKSETLSDDAQKNLLNLYTSATLKVLNNWNDENKNYARLLHPDNVEQLFKVYKAKVPTNSLFINHNIVKAEYFKKAKQESKIKDSFDFILNNYDKYNSTIDEKVNLASFFKQWNQTQLASEILLKEYENNTINPKGLLLLTQMLSNYYNTDNEVFKQINEKTVIQNKEKWCNWINQNFQKLAENNTKDLYCSSCKK